MAIMPDRRIQLDPLTREKLLVVTAETAADADDTAQGVGLFGAFFPIWCGHRLPSVLHVG